MSKEKFHSVEDAPNRHKMIDDLAKEATKNAYFKAKASGISVIYKKGKYLVKESADGKIQRIAKHNLSLRKVKSGTHGKL